MSYIVFSQVLAQEEIAKIQATKKGAYSLGGVLKTLFGKEDRVEHVAADGVIDLALAPFISDAGRDVCGASS